MAALIMSMGAIDIPEQDFTRPGLRIVVDNSVVDRSGISTDTGIYLPIRHFGDMFGGDTQFIPELGLVTLEYHNIEFAPKSHRIGDFTFMNYNYINEIFGHTTTFYNDLNLLHISTTGQRFDRNRVRDIVPSFDGFTEEDLHWMARIIFAEARGESFEGMLAVGSVVMNRVYHPSYPNTVREVIFDRRNGVQFSPTANGSINNTPCINSFLAALDVLEGRRNASNALFFMNPVIAQTNWISRNRPYAFTLQNHAFFY